MTKLTDKEREIVSENHNLIYFVIGEMNLDIDTYYDIAAIGLCKSVQKFNPSIGIKYCTYATMCIRNEILQDIRKQKAQKRNKYKAVELRDNLCASSEYDPAEILIRMEESK